MLWQIIDERSNLLGEFIDERTALAAAREMVAAEPGVTDEIALAAFKGDGSGAHPALTGRALLTAANEHGRVGGPQAL